MADQSIKYVVELLRDCNISYDHEELKSAFADPGNQTAILAWVEEYLSPETLLTKEEAALYAHLVKSGEFDALSTNSDLSALRGLDDQEIHDATEKLKRSTATIEKQTEALTAQQNAIAMLVKNKKQGEAARIQSDKNQQRVWSVDKGATTAAVEELSQNLKYQTSDLALQSKSSEAKVKQTIEDILRSDDKLLHSLQKLASDLDPQRDDDELVARIRELCARLIKHTVEGIRTKLDRIYLDTLNKFSDGPSNHEQSKEVADLQEELESLYSEILPVAQMSTEQQYLEPAIREISARDGQGQERSVKAVKYMRDCLESLVHRMEAILERAEEHQAYKMALQVVLDEAKNELLRAESSTSIVVSQSAKSTVQRRGTLPGASPVRPKGRRSSVGLEEDSKPELQLLRSLGVSPPFESMNDLQCMEDLERALSDRRAKLEGHSNNLQSTTESSISNHLHDAHITLELLRDSLLADTLYNKVSLLDPEIESSVAGFELDLQALQEEMEAVNLHKLTARNVHKEQFLERWAR